MFRTLEPAWVVGNVRGPTPRDIWERKSIERYGRVGYGCVVAWLFRRGTLPNSPGHKGAKNRSKAFETLSAKLRLGLAKRGRVYSMRVAKGGSAERWCYIRILQLRWMLRVVARRFRVLLARGIGLGAAAKFRDDVN